MLLTSVAAFHFQGWTGLKNGPGYQLRLPLTNNKQKQRNLLKDLIGSGYIYKTLIICPLQAITFLSFLCVL